LKQLFLKPLKQADAIEVARNIKEQASIPVEDEVLEQMAGDISWGGTPPRVSALALSTLLRLIADEASSGKEFTLADYRDQGGALGLISSALLDQLDLAAPRYSRDILKIIEERISKSSLVASSDFGGLPKDAEPEIVAALEALSSYDQRILTLNSETGNYLVNQEWKPAFLVASTGRDPEVIAEERSLKAKYSTWETHRAGKGRYGRGRLLLTRGDLRWLKWLSAQLSLSGGLRAYIRLSREYRRGQLMALLLILCLLIPVAAASMRAVRGWVEVKKENGSGIPTDFATAGKGLKHLSLLSGCLVTNLTWLPRGLEELDAVCPRVKSLEGVPPNIKKLNVSSSSIVSLKGLPRTVTDLDVSSTRLSEDALALRGLSVVHLNAAGIRISNLSNLSRSLESLVLSHPDISSIDGLPEGLSSLSLLGTSVRSLRGLPLGIVKLRVKDNGWEAVDYLPPQLDYLDTDRTLKEGVRFPDSLRGLALRSRFFASLPEGLSSLEISNRASLGSPLPRGLERLWVNSSEPSADLNELPAGLKALKFVWPPDSRFESLPVGLESLDLTWSSGLPDLASLRSVLTFLNLTKTPIADFRKVPGSVTNLIDQFCAMSVAKEFPPQLRGLDLSGCRNLSLVYSLPPTLETLDLSGTAIAKLPPLPKNLAQLDISNTRIGGNFPDLPKKLIKLTIHFGQFDSIKGLPKSVQWLVFAPNVGQAQADNVEQETK
jgi:hypothetical protein